MNRFRAASMISALALILTQSVRGQNSGPGADSKQDATLAAAASGNNGQSGASTRDFANQIEELRQMVLEQNQQIAAQQSTIREQQDKVDALTAEVKAGKLPNPVTIQPAVYSGGTTLAMIAAPPPQITPAAGFTPPDNTPKIAVGVTLFPNFIYQEHPTVADSDGNFVRKSSFDIGRSYLNITGNISHILAFRITPDISRETNTASALFGSLVFRIKYAFMQANLDDWMTRGSWLRFGIQQTPYVDFEEGIYRYRFQGTMFEERAGFNSFSSSDAGASFHYNLPSNYGDMHFGVYNGETYNKAEVNGQKSFQVRGTLRPFAKSTPIARGFRATIFYNGDHYLASAERTRLIANATFEYKYFNMGFDYVWAHDQVSPKPGSTNSESRGYSIWLTPRTTKGWEALLRYDHLIPNTSSAFVTGATAPDATTPFDSQQQNRMILGIAYWFPHEGNVSSVLMLDWDAQIFRNIATTQPVRALAVHGLVNF